MTATQRPPRGGFTLIELLVVIAIVALLAAIAVGTYFRVQESQTQSATESRIKNINAGLQRQWSAVRDTADKEFRDNTLGCASTLTTYCGNDRDRAKSLYFYLKFKNEFPQTFDEAAADTKIPATGTAVLTLPKKKTFANLPNTAPATANDAAHQSAVLLRMIVSERAARGETYGDEATGAGGGEVTVSGLTAPVFKDIWGTPLAYVRFATNTEINASPYTKPGTTSNDPLDPLNKLRGTWTNKGTAAVAVFGVAGLQDFPGENWLLTVVSAGSDKEYGDHTTSILTKKANGLVEAKTGADSSGNVDDIYGYRLTREGQQGN